MTKKLHTIADLTPDPRNANKGTERGAVQLENSLRKYGAGRSILVDQNGVVLAGNKTLEQAAAMGLEIVTVKTDGNKLVVVQRDDLDVDGDPKARELAIADNRVGQVGLDWDVDVLQEMQGLGVDLCEWWREDELEAMFDTSLPADADGKEYDESVEDEVEFIECPECGHKWPK